MSKEKPSLTIEMSYDLYSEDLEGFKSSIIEIGKKIKKNLVSIESF